MNRSLSALTLAVGLVVPAVSAAEDVYRSVMPNGSIVYGESPMPGAKQVRKVAAPPSGVVIVTPEDKAAASRIQTQAGGVTVVPKKEGGPTHQGGAAAGTLQSNSTELPKRPY